MGSALAVARCWTVGFLFAACSSLPEVPKLVDPPSGRQAVHALAIIVEPAAGAVRIEEPPTGPWRGMLAGMHAGWADGVEFSKVLGTKTGGGAALVYSFFCAAAFTVCIVGETLHGAFATMSAEEASGRVATVRRAFEAVAPGLGLAEALSLAVAAARPELRVVTYGAPADATLTVRVAGFGLLGQRGVDPDVCLVVLIETEWAAGALLHRAKFQYRSPVSKLTTWSDDERQIGDELALARTQLAEHIADALLLVEVRR